MVSDLARLFFYEPNIDAPYDVTDVLQEAIDRAHSPSSFSGWACGREVLLPRGYGYFTKPLWVKPGVTLVGPGTEAGGLVWAGDDSVEHPIWIGSQDRSAAFSCGLRNMQVRSLQRASDTTLDRCLVYTNSAQHTGGLEKVKLMGAGRTCLKLETGWGGASTVLLRDIETHNTAGISGAPNNPQIVLDYPSAFIEAENIICQHGEGASASCGVLVKSGYVHLRGFHAEWVKDGIVIDQALAPHHVSIRGATGGSGVTNLIRSASTDRLGAHIIIGASVKNGAQTLYKDDREGGGTNSFDILTERVF